MLKPAVMAVSLALVGPSAALVEKPPVQFQHPPREPAVVVWAHPFIVDSFCRSRSDVPADMIVLACTFPGERFQVMPDPCLYPDEYYASLQCHENAHLNGWQH